MSATNEESIYGKDVIVGNQQDAAKILEGRDVQITVSNTQVVSTKTDGEVTDTPEGSDSSAHKTIGEKTDEAPELTPEQKLEADVQNQIKAEADAKADLEAKGVDFDAIAAEFENNGTLSAETLAGLDKAGYPASVVNAYMAGLEATAARFESQVYEYAGGKPQFERMVQFIQSQGEPMVKAFNNILTTGDLTQIKVAMQGFQAQITQKYGTANKTILGTGSNTNGIQGFQTKAEMTSAMRDPRYGRDPQYTNEVKQKTMRAKFL